MFRWKSVRLSCLRESIYCLFSSKVPSLPSDFHSFLSSSLLCPPVSILPVCWALLCPRNQLQGNKERHPPPPTHTAHIQSGRQWASSATERLSPWPRTRNHPLVGRGQGPEPAIFTLPTPPTARAGFRVTNTHYRLGESLIEILFTAKAIAKLSGSVSCPESCV